MILSANPPFIGVRGIDLIFFPCKGNVLPLTGITAIDYLESELLKNCLNTKEKKVKLTPPEKLKSLLYFSI